MSRSRFHTSVGGRWTTVASLAVGLACGPAPGPRRWIDDRAAVVQCTTSGRALMPPVLTDAPVPHPPRGLLARRLDPMALNDLGFARDRIVCAVLTPPSEHELDIAPNAWASFITQQTQASEQAFTIGGRCTCEIADALNGRALLSACDAIPRRRSCDRFTQSARMQSVVQPLFDALEDLPLPWVHWRLVGPTDRPGWFADHASTLLDRYDGGTLVFLPSQPLLDRPEKPWISALLDEPDVVAVLLQDSGQSLVVAREQGGMLILDHFETPILATTQPSLAVWLQQRRIDAYRAALAQPTQTRTLALTPGRGNVIELDVHGLDHIDAWIDAMTMWSDVVPLAPIDTPPTWIDRITVQAPFGHEGRQLRLRAQLNSDGRQWAQGLGDTRISPSLLELQQPLSAPPPWPSSRLPYVRRATVTDRVLIRGWASIGYWASELELTQPGSIRGQANAWSFTLPPAAASRLASHSPWEGLRRLVAEQPMHLTTTIDASRGVIDASIE